MMNQISLNNELKDVLEEVVVNFFKENVMFREWMSLKEAAKYIGVSQNTLAKYREMGLKVFVIEGVSRVSRDEINRFLETYSN